MSLPISWAVATCILLGLILVVSIHLPLQARGVLALLLGLTGWLVLIVRLIKTLRRRDLTKDLVAVLTGVGLDPFLGVLHQPRYGRPALALDLAEEFRALVAESVALQCFNNGEVNEKSFMRGHLGVVLTADGRRSVIQAHERRLESELKHPLFGYQVSYRRVLDLQARVLAASFTGELDSYTPLMTR